MKKMVLISVMILLCELSVFGQTCEWAERIGGKDIEQFRSQTIDRDGNLYVIGNYNSDTLNFNNGKFLINNGRQECFIAKYNSSRVCLYVDKITGSSDVHASCIAIDSSNNFYVSGFSGKGTINFNNGKSLTQSKYYFAYLAKYNNNGNCLWAEKIGGNCNDIYLRRISFDLSGNVFIAGWYESDSLIFNNGKSLPKSIKVDCFFAKYDSNGSCKWVQQITGNSNDNAVGIASVLNGDIYIIGGFQSDTLYFNNDKKFVKYISIDNNSNKYYNDGFIAKYNSEGKYQWAEQIGGSGNDAIESVALDYNGNVYVAGIFDTDTLIFNNDKSLTKSGNMDVFLIKYNNVGGCQWAQRIAGNGFDYICNISVDISNNIYIVGDFSSDTLIFNNNITLENNRSQYIYFAKYNSDGNCHWAEKIVGQDIEYVYSVIVDIDYNIYIAGGFISDTLNFNNGKSITNRGSGDIFIAKYSQSNTSISDKPIQNNISIYPNPTTDYIEINNSIGACSNGNEASLIASDLIQIFNTLGEIILTVEQTPSSVQRINISNLTPGMYFIKIGDNVEKFVKM